MAPSLNLKRIIHGPLRAEGRNIKDRFGVILASALGATEAQAMVELINTAAPRAGA